MSSFLLIYIDENTNFDPSKTMAAISSMDDAYIGLSEAEYSECSGEYKFEDDFTSINIGRGWYSIAAESTGKAALNFAFNLQQLLDVDLTVTDSNYSFLAKLGEISSVEELENIMVQGIYMADV
ncbi:hypothetical protein NIES4102_27020 [Chondrocystis sp. NIES-4102]|nr:hypothetical protein NIES4102_27020 [Chondrocystis sp. NIES-4102]